MNRRTYLRTTRVAGYFLTTLIGFGVALADGDRFPQPTETLSDSCVDVWTCTPNNDQ